MHDTKIDFIGKRYIFFGVSAVLILAGLLSLIIRGGPNYGIDFSGGSLIQMSFASPVKIDDVRTALSAGGLSGLELQSALSGSRSSIIMRLKKTEITQDELTAKINAIMKQKYPDNQFAIERTEFVGPAVGRHLFKQAMLALVFSFAGIIVYVAFRFHSGVWGAAGVIGIMHDVFIVFGLFSLFNKEITLTIVAAFLTVAGYSINDTIVIFDRIRDNMRMLTKEKFGDLINKSINQTLSRTIITSLTVFIVVVALFFWGGDVLHDFAFALLVGVIVGSYSTIFVCTPMIYEWEEAKKRRTAAMYAGKRAGQK